MIIHALPHGLVDSVTYIVSEGNACVVIDCGVNTREVLRVIERNHLTASHILLTHGHFDHIYHAKSLKEATGAKLCLHEAEMAFYRNPFENCFALFGLEGNMDLADPDIPLHDGSVLEAGGLNLKIIHTPGHTPGSICILAGGKLFSGDTLFAMSVGRTDLPGGSSRDLNDSINQKLFTLDEGVIVYPGHGPETLIGYEKANNPYV